MRDALRHPGFRRLFLGRLVTNAGDSLYAIAAMWLVYSLTGSSLYTGIAGFLTFAPSALQAFAGPLVDRWSLRRTLVATQVVQMLLVLVVPLAHVLGLLSVWVVLAVMPLLALLNQFVYPASNAAVPRLVPKEDLVSANAAMSFAYQGVDLVFNAAAGVLVALIGAVALYVVDSVTFLVAVLLFVSLRIPGDEPATDDGEPRADEEQPTTGAGARATRSPDRPTATTTTDGGTTPGVLASYLAELRAGISYVRGTVVFPIVAAGAVANFTFGGVLAVLPAFAAARGGPGTYGLLMATVAGGILVGALSASLFDGWGYGRLSIVGFGFGGVVWLAALATPWLAGTAALLALALVPVGVTNVVANAMVQNMVPEGLLGRVTAVASSLSTVMMPVGAVLGGAAASVVGVVAVMAGGAVGLLFIAAYVAARPSLRSLPPASQVETVPG
jgi:MFS family permease